LSPKLSKEYGNIGPICICYRVTTLIHLIDPQTLKVIEIDQKGYWAAPFMSICSPKKLRQYCIMDIEKDEHKPHVFGKESNKHAMADAWIMKASEMGGQQQHTKTHLGRLLNAGDMALGFDLANTNVNDDNLDSFNMEDLPDVILVKKIYGDSQKRHKRRKWKLNRLNVDKGDAASIATADDNDLQDLMNDIEDDPELRATIPIYKDNKKLRQVAESEADYDETDVPQISLDEMLDDFDDMQIKDDPMDG